MFTQTLISILAVLGASPLAVADPYPITDAPVPRGSNGVPLRKNINELQSAGEPQWDLYIRTLSDMQRANYHDTLSYFQISGIHGRPYIEWNNTGGPAYDDCGGYCPHGEQLFLSWHRPYIVLFEQVLVSHARRIAHTYPQRYRQQYFQAAESLRSPFWDWAAVSQVPPATVPAKMTVNFPNGQSLQKRQIDNPLASYTIPRQVLQGEYGAFDSESRPRILHCPAPDNNPASANQRLASSPYRQWVYDAFTRASNFTDFSTESNSIVSLEVIHNGIHWDAVCGQQFVMPELAGFDPLFMLHHTNLDRLWSYWQALRPDQATFTNSYAGQSRFTVPTGTTITPRSPLQPFYSGGGRSHTTESVQRIRDFGYSYTGLEYWQKSQAQMAQDVKRLINRLYAPNSRSLKRRQQPATGKRYFARIRFDRAHVPRPCKVQLYVCNQHVSSIVVSAQPPRGHMAAGVPLDKITQTSEVTAMSNDATAQLLQSDLSVKVVKLDDSVVESVESLQIKLEEVDVVHPVTPDQFPRFQASKIRPIDARRALFRGKSVVKRHAPFSFKMQVMLPIC